MTIGEKIIQLRNAADISQEQLAETLGVSRQSISKWEMDQAQPEIDKALELCRVFSCSLDNLFREELDACDEKYANLRVETVPAFRYIKYAVISTDPEGDAIDRVRAIARSNSVERPQIIGWDFPKLSMEQVNVYGMHGYEAAWILPEGVMPDGMTIHTQKAHKYAAIHIECPFENPFVTIPGAYRTLMDYMRLNGLEHTEKDVIPCFETDGDSMDIYIACL